MSTYPKKKYSPTGGFVIAEDAVHEEQLGPGWQDNPRPEPAATDEATPPKAAAKRAP